MYRFIFEFKTSRNILVFLYRSFDNSQMKNFIEKKNNKIICIGIFAGEFKAIT